MRLPGQARSCCDYCGHPIGRRVPYINGHVSIIREPTASERVMLTDPQGRVQVVDATDHVPVEVHASCAGYTADLIARGTWAAHRSAVEVRAAARAGDAT